MDMEYYRNFIAIVEAGSLSAASKRVHVAQPALSNQLKLLQKKFGTQLVNIRRGVHNIELTNAGCILYNKAKYLCSLEDDTQREISDCVNGYTGTLRVSLSPSMSISFIQTYLSKFSEEYPQINYELYEVSILEPKTLKDLKLDYLDMYYVHWPFPNYHAPHCDVDSRNPDSKPFTVERFMKTWRQMERLVDMGLTKHIGMSNMTIPKLEAVLPLCRIKPAAIEMELHPCFQQPELFDYCRAHGIEVVGFCPIGSPERPERDKMPEDIADIELPELKAIAAAHGVHPAVICIKWAVQRGASPIPFSLKEKNYTMNLKCVTEDPLTEEEMETIRSLDKNNRLIKGHVFLWEGAKDWHDLWDEDGVIVK